ncbi:putative transcription factor TIFY family [Helianthus annuus]|uniref:Protein TIFY n=1 Tax=Helianthus annuus TaxID=4232 RepID=A0A251S9X0_HELAN|nr:protein TIFY 5A [Helianthus annuus]KAF5764698.1 putative transcription factor TIFY family [Helianthus annuus]KAJ0455837.1 putative transcription factor TIFY family [Helianthus annuus]KAJ0831432.1 putative transcription factor TIFY family [Helianthus annuus]KAJ0844899.1 putative transcription factor TIFY family [Helianthus annuus]
MRRNCNLELRLVPPSPPYHLRQENSRDDINMVGGDLKGKQNQQLTIFYDGKVSVCDVTELQARTIIKLAASEETDDQWRRTPGSTTSSEPASSSPLASPGLSMKRSLQRFLQKRKHRIQATSPYHP